MTPVAPTYFTPDQFQCMRTWHDRPFDKTNASHRQAYRQLCEAYDITKQWASACNSVYSPIAQPPELFADP